LKSKKTKYNLNEYLFVNRYRYALNNPLRYTDPSGNEYEDIRDIDDGDDDDGPGGSGYSYKLHLDNQYHEFFTSIDIFGGVLPEIEILVTLPIEIERIVNDFLFSEEKDLDMNTQFADGGDDNDESDDYDYNGGIGSIEDLPDIDPSMFPGVKIKNSFWADLTGKGWYSSKTKTINVPKNTKPSYVQHEYGHHLQSKRFTKEQYDAIEASSLQNAIFQFLPWVENHDTFWTERDANRRAINFFGPNSEIAKFGLWPQ
jgi:hypothetical protein